MVVTKHISNRHCQPRQRTKYLGVANEKDGEYSKPNKTTSAAIQLITAKSTTPNKNTIVDFGDSYAISEISKTSGLSNIITNSFGNLDSIMALVCFQITEGSALYNCENWLDGNIASKIFTQAKISSQDISKLIQLLGKQDLQVKFFKDYVAKFFPNKRGVLIDSTALPSAINSSINAFGYSSGNIEQNISCLMLVDQQSKLPIYFRAIGGDIADISTVKSTVAEIR